MLHLSHTCYKYVAGDDDVDADADDDDEDEDEDDDGDDDDDGDGDVCCSYQDLSDQKKSRCVC